MQVPPHVAKQWREALSLAEGLEDGPKAPLGELTLEEVCTVLTHWLHATALLPGLCLACKTTTLHDIDVDTTLLLVAAGQPHNVASERWVRGRGNSLTCSLPTICYEHQQRLTQNHSSCLTLAYGMKQHILVLDSGWSSTV